MEYAVWGTSRIRQRGLAWIEAQRTRDHGRAIRNGTGEYQPLPTAASKRTPPATKRKLPVQSCRARILGIWFDPPRRRRRKTGTNDGRADQRCPATAKPSGDNPSGHREATERDFE